METNQTMQFGVKTSNHDIMCNAFGFASKLRPLYGAADDRLQLIGIGLYLSYTCRLSSNCSSPDVDSVDAWLTEPEWSCIDLFAWVRSQPPQTPLTCRQRPLIQPNTALTGRPLTIHPESPMTAPRLCQDGRSAES